MPNSTTRHGIQFPISEDLIKGDSVPAKLAQDIRALAVTVDAALSSEGGRAQTAAESASRAYADLSVGDLRPSVLEAKALSVKNEADISEHAVRLESVEVLGGLTPGSVTDATMTNVATNGASTFSAQQKQAIRANTGLVGAGAYATVQAAITGSIASRSTLTIDAPTSVAGNIPDFWDARLKGRGSIVRGGSEFFVDPKPSSTAAPVNTIHVNTVTGSDTNDGLSAAFPMKTIARVYAAVLRPMTADQAAGAKWVISLTGAFVGGQQFSQLPDFPHGLEFAGEPLTVSGKPVTTISKGATSSSIGLWFEPVPTSVRIRNIHFDGFTNGFSGYALLGKGGGRLEAYDCTASNCDIGFSTIRNVSYHFLRCSTDATVRNGFRTQYSSSGTFDTCVADGSENYGFFVSRNAVAHIDYCTIQNCGIGILADMAARVAMIEGYVAGNTVGVQAEGAAELNTGTDTLFGPNTRDAAYYGVGRNVRLHSIAPTTNEWNLYKALPDFTLTGSTSNTSIYGTGSSVKLPINHFTTPDSKLTLKASGSTSGAGQKTLRFYSLSQAGATQIKQLATVSIPEASSGQYSAIMEVFGISPTLCRYVCTVTVNGGPSIVSSGTSEIVQGHQWSFRLMGINSQTDGSLTVDTSEILLAG